MSESFFRKPIPRLGPSDIEVKVKQVSQKGAVALLYKTARTDMRILDECVGPENWQDEYHEIKGNLYCTIRIRNPETEEWVGKTDCGTESREDSEGNQKKGEASDAFKRAGFKWGIGRELYTAPFIFLSVPTQQSQYGNSKGKFEMVDRFASFDVKSIDYNDDGSIRQVVIVDKKGVQVFPSRGASHANDRHPLVCDICGNPISGIMYNGQQLTAQQTADKFGKCLVCLQAEAAQRQQNAG